MENNVIKELSTVELQERLVSEKLRLNKMKINHAVTPLENPNIIKTTKQGVARIMTEIRMREINSKSTENN
ncbi:MAG: 50S ribosomal protein L29 [Bacteroidales bacterium]|nr:50S ribosomal protein L29 [Bacteroidales bacterium]MDY0053368.1 50S ribosomal protein L29 [Bacteroidales bacterium]